MTETIAAEQPSSKAESRVLLIDDEIQLSQMIAFNLALKGFDVFMAHNGNDGLEQFEKCHPDAVLLDVKMPGMNGFDVLRKIRSRSLTPIIMFTAQSDIQSRVLGLSLGANDYLVKPCSLDEMEARLRVQIRRQNCARSETGIYPEPSAVPGPMQPQSRYRFHGKALALQAKEKQVLELLESMNGQIVTHSRLRALSPENPENSVKGMRVTISKLRGKLKQAFGVDPIHTVYGIGYRFIAPDSGQSPLSAKAP